MWNLCAVGAQIMRAADCSPFVKKYYFLTATTPQALACGVTAQLVQKPRRVSPPQRRKKVSIIFSGDMCGGENTSQAASVEFVCRRRTNYACSRLQPLCQKVLLFDSNDPAGSCLRGDGSACPKASQSFAAAAAKESLDHFLRRHARRRKYRSACKRARHPPRRTARALQQAAIPFVKKVLLF